MPKREYYCLFCERASSEVEQLICYDPHKCICSDCLMECVEKVTVKVTEKTEDEK